MKELRDPKETTSFHGHTKPIDLQRHESSTPGLKRSNRWIAPRIGGAGKENSNLGLNGLVFPRWLVEEGAGFIKPAICKLFINARFMN